jgi:hypothetical protein
VRSHRLVVAACASAALALVGWYAAATLDTSGERWPAELDDRQFWAMVQTFSEPDGVFNPVGGYRSDNLISNERSLQQVMPALLHRPRSGAYLGVGPEQNFTYIATLEPTIAFVIDIRRENLLLHLMYKAVAEESADRVEFLSRLFARPRPSGLRSDAAIETIFTAFEDSPWSAALARANLGTILGRLEETHHFPLNAKDKAGIADLYSKFGRAGPALRWDPSGGAWIPSYGELMAQADPQGNQRGYLATESAFRVFQRYHARNRIVPLVGDLGGTTTLRAVGRYLASHAMIVTAFYTSNVEGYLRGDALQRFVANVAALPRDEHSLFVRTRFNTVGYTQGRPDFETTTMTEPIGAYVDLWLGAAQ